MARAAYFGIQFSVWAEMIVAGNESPPTRIMNFDSRPCDRSSNFEEALTNAVGKLASAIFPTPVTRGVNSPRRSLKVPAAAEGI